MTLTRNLGYHNKLIDITIERIEELNKDKADVKSPYDQHPIEKESFRLIGEELDESQFSALELPVVKRVIHSTADFEFKDLMRLSPNAIQAGIEAIKNGCNIITDVKMVLSGITKNRLEPFGAQVYCFSSDEDVARLSTEENITKTSASMRKASKFMQGGIVAIGNAPTALFELLKIINNGGPKPALIVGVPVGFVGAAESKEELMKSGCEYIATAGRKGGSTVAVAIVNAIAISAGTLTPTK
ncbi:MAG: precorrin-8X methylmutase [Deltaproteobacteria bacterium]|nr:precorrin-8X methylmutase [Deltaproteobacteria bacterium]